MKGYPIQKNTKPKHAYYVRIIRTAPD